MPILQYLPFTLNLNCNGLLDQKHILRLEIGSLLARHLGPGP